MSRALVLSLVAVLTACSGTPPDDDADVLVLAAASLTDVFGELETIFEREHPGIEIEMSFGASSALRTQIEQGAPADVIALADTAVIDALVAGGYVRNPTLFATNALTIAVPSGNPGDVTSIDDFTRDDLLLGTCALQVPCGAYADEVFAAAKIDPRLDTMEPDVRSLAAKIARGELDAGLVYVTDVFAADGALVGIGLGSETARPAEYPIALVDGADEQARAFVDFVLSESGGAVISAAGFGPP